jgi:hypothetical protein
MNLNALKGMLILLVILDHNDFSRLFIDGFLYGFTFHVVGFMTIPFLKEAPPLDRKFVAYAFRQYYPFFLVATVTALIAGLATRTPAWQQLQAWLLALYSGNAFALKAATHMSLLWFLPSFIALVTLRSAVEHLGRGAKVLVIALLWAIHPLIGAVAASLQDALPLGLLPALYVAPLAWLIVWLQRMVFSRVAFPWALLLAAAVFVPVKYLQVRAHLYNEVGFAEVADYTRPYALLLNDLESVLGVLVLFQLCRLPLGRFAEACGRYSIQIYLFHAFIALAVYKAVLHLPLPAAAQFALSLAITAVASLGFARWLAAQPFAQRFVFPRSPGALFGAQPAGAGPLPLVPTASRPNFRR